MKFTEMELSGVYLIEREDREDERGFFARTYCREEFSRKSLIFELKQCNLSQSHKKGTLRGMHYQKAPYGEIKLVSCLKGAIFDCIVDIRKDSPTYLRHLGVELPAFGPMLYVPKGFAHGFQTLEDDTLVEYKVSACYMPEAEAGLRWNDPKLGIDWPDCDKRIISAKDAANPLL
jgi:dTDP-4-dehydrorhamnose 3,5-epimerase